MPADLRELLSIHSGGRLFDGRLWNPSMETVKSGMIWYTRFFHQTLPTAPRRSFGLVAAGGRVGVAALHRR